MSWLCLITHEAFSRRVSFYRGAISLSIGGAKAKIKRRSTCSAPHCAFGLSNESVRARLLSDKILSQLQRRLTHDSTRVPVYPRGILETEPSCVALVRDPVSRLYGYGPLYKPPEGIFCQRWDYVPQFAFARYISLFLRRVLNDFKDGFSRTLFQEHLEKVT